MLDITVSIKSIPGHSKCLGYQDPYMLDYDCGYNTKIDCSDCKYNIQLIDGKIVRIGRKDPNAKCNQL